MRKSGDISNFARLYEEETNKIKIFNFYSNIYNVIYILMS